MVSPPFSPQPTPPPSPAAALARLPLSDLRIRGGPFVLALVCFLLPFVNLTCTADRSMHQSVTGLQLVTGMSIDAPDMGMGMRGDAKRLPPSPMALLALFSVLAGLSVFALKDDRALWTGLVAGLSGMLFLLMLRAHIGSQVQAEGQGMFVAESRFGYVLAFLSLLAAAVLHGYLLRARLAQLVQQHTGLNLAELSPSRVAPPPPNPPGPSTVPPGARFDPLTGAPLAPPPRFDPYTGQPIDPPA